jgi:hypothetical protein
MSALRAVKDIFLLFQLWCFGRVNGLGRRVGVWIGDACASAEDGDAKAMEPGEEEGGRGCCDDVPGET